MPLLLAVLAAPPARAADDPLAPLAALESSGARVGALVVAGKRVVAARQPDSLRNPASVTKVFTAAAALSILGPDTRLRTEVRVDGEGPEAAQLVLVPSGDPSLAAGDLRTLAACVRDAGVLGARRLVVAPGPFDSRHEPPAFDTKATDAPYRAGVASFQVDLNAIQVTVTPGKPGEPPRVEAGPDGGDIRMAIEAVTAGGKAKGRDRKKGAKGKGGRLAVAVGPDGPGRLVVRVTGTVTGKKPVVVFRRVPDPEAHALALFRTALARAGVTVPAAVPGAVPEGARTLCARDSAPVRDLIVPMLKDSLNPVAESLLRLAGARGAGGPVGFEEGAAALSRFLGQAGLAAGSYRFRNGSGLYDANRVTARSVVRLLEAARAGAGGDAFVAGLPVAATDGTLKRRLKALKGRVRAKTGTLDDAVSLAGYLETGNRVVTFAFLVEAGEDGKLDAAAARRAIDAALEAVAADL